MSLLERIRRKAVFLLADKHAKTSFSQCGEDLIVDFIFLQLKQYKIKYLDIGAHHPSYINNTTLFYRKGSTGVSIEPDPALFAEFLKLRPNDITLNIGIGADGNSEADFYVMSERTLNTFSKEEADRYASYGKKIESVIKIPLVNINDIIDQKFVSAPDYISLDVEGYDLNIIRSFNFSKYRPKVWCIETITYTEDKTEKKVDEIIKYMLEKDYFIYADTYINTIFVDKQAWKNR